MKEFLKKTIKSNSLCGILYQSGMKQALELLKEQHSQEWIERLDVTVEPVERLTSEEDANDDFKRELIL